MSDNFNTTTSRGRPPKIDRSLLIQAILSRKSDIIRLDGKILSKTASVWREISDTLQNKVCASTIYSYVTDNKENLGDQFTRREKTVKQAALNKNYNDADLSDWDKTCQPAGKSMEPGLQKFRIAFSKKEYMDLLCTTMQKRTEKSRNKVYQREKTKLKPGFWEEYISNALWQVRRIKCEFNFRTPRLSKDGFSGSIIATCKCGSHLDIHLLPDCENDQFINADCLYTPGTGDCGKQYLRQPMREEVAKKLSTVSAAVFRSDQARKLMKPGDSEPGILYKTSLLYKAKQEAKMEKHCDPDTFTALGIMKRESHKLSIHAMGYDPFYLLYWTNYQIHVYRMYASSDHPTISIDSTGSVVRKLMIDKCETKHIFLYQAVVNYHLGQFPVTQMLSECHDTVTIHIWLERWLQAGVPVPEEVISDSCKALLTAIVRTFSVHKTIEEYADASWENVPPICYVRLDVAHFIKMYANFFSSAPRRVRIFYLSSIGQLIMARTIETAADIVKAILIVAHSESDGNDTEGLPTPCEIHKTKLKNWIPNNSKWTSVEPDGKKKRKKETVEDKNEEDENEKNEIAMARNPTIFNDAFTENSWSRWGSKLNEEAKTLAAIEGDRDNAHYMPKLAARLLKDIRWLPLWSCILRDRYGYGRVPATSAPSESDLDYVKTHLMKIDKPIRADEFVQSQIDIINGRMYIADAKTIDDSVTDESENEISDSPSLNHSIEDKIQSAKINKNHIQAEEGESGDEEAQLRVVNLESMYTSSCELCRVLMQHNSDAIKDSGDKILCETCKKIDHQRIFASREEEDWGDKTSQDKNPMEQRKMIHIPIMKNGGCTALIVQKIEGINITLTKTCCFDSILQILIAIAFDEPTAVETIMRLDVPITKLALYIRTKGLTYHAYKQRAIIMFNWYKKTFRMKAEEFVQYEKKQLKSLCIDCDSSAAGLASSLFHDIPSVSEITSCEARCTNKRKNLPTVCLKPRTLTDPEFANALLKYVALSGNRTCSKKGGCNKKLTTAFSHIGNFVIFELFDNDSDNAQDIFTLGSIPIKISDPLGGNDLQLKGVINYIQPRCAHCKVDIDYTESGHYTAFCLRSSGRWMEYNDIGPEQKEVSSKHEVNVHVLFYFRP